MKRRASEEAGATFFPLEEIPAGAVRLAQRRATGVVKAWAAAPNLTGLDLLTLAVSLYLQGVADGFEAAEQNMKRKAER